jgi:AraC-like DNA-binding protein
LLNAISHPRMAEVLAAIHREPSHGWTLERMAAAGGLSRTTLVKTFQELMATSPMAYLAEWRMHLAQSALMADDRAVAEIANAVGYPVPQCFSRAFKKSTGLSPTDYRRKRKPPD